MFEKYTLEQAQDEAAEIGKIAQKEKLNRNEKGEPSGSDYKKAEESLMLQREHEKLSDDKKIKENEDRNKIEEVRKKISGENNEAETEVENINYDKAIESWDSIVLGIENPGVENIDTNSKDNIKKFLADSLEKEIDQVAENLGIEADRKMMEELNSEKEIGKRADIEKEIIQDIARKINKIPSEKWAFYPKEIEKAKRVNCSGAALLCGHLLDKIGLKTEYGSPAGHAVNFSRLSDGSLLYIDARNNIVKKIDAEDENIGSLTVRRINDPGIEYKIIPVFQQAGAVEPILGNLESLKNEARHESSDKKAKEIYDENKDLLNAVNFQKMSEELFPEYAEFSKSDPWKHEEKRIEDIRSFDKNMDKIGQEIEKYPKEIREKIIKEVHEHKKEINEYLKSGEKENELDIGISQEAITSIKKIKTELKPLKNWNDAEYNKFVDNFVDKM